MSKARGLADLGNVYSDGALSHRNLIINGGLGVWQRAVSSSNLGLSYYTADRFWSYAGGSGNVERSTDVPDGFIYSLLWNRASGGSLGTSVELGRSGFNPYGMLTCSMYLKGNFTGTALYLNFRNYSGGGADSVAITTKTDFGNYTDWTRVTIPVDCTGIAAHANNKMLNIEFGDFPVGGKITGLQLEAGDTATPFEHRSYGDELARCQRYYQTSGGLTHPHVVPFNSYNAYGGKVTFITTMRVPPTMVSVSSRYYDGAWNTPTSSAFSSTLAGSTLWRLDGSFTAYVPRLGELNWTADAEL